MSSPIWQPVTWLIFHHITKNYREEYRQHYIDFFETFKIIIPCKICRTHYNENLNKQGMMIDQNINSQNIFNWTVDLHNTVNRQNGKRAWTHERANQYYSKNRLNDNLIKLFLIEYTKMNFRKSPEKTDKLFDMLRNIVYLHPNDQKKNKLIDFKEKFELRHDTFKNWIYAVLLILKSK